MRFDSQEQGLGALQRALSIPKEPKVVGRPEDYFYLLQLRSSGRTEQARRIIADRAEAVKRFWFNHLGLRAKRGRPRNQGLRLVWMYAAEMKRRGTSVARMARRLYPDDYKKDPSVPIERLRKGIETIERQRLAQKVAKRRPE